MGSSQKYKKHELRDHIYTLPDTYIGSVEQTQIETYLYDSESKMMVKKTINYVPGLYKIYDEILVNALDHVMRLKEQAKSKKGQEEDIRFVKNIKITINKETGYIEIFNDGDGIDVEKNNQGIYFPQMIFGELLTSSNYDQDVEKLWGGKNGYGSKLANIFSKEFTVETIDHRNKKIYTQKFSDNMKLTEEPLIKSCAKIPYTKITFLPDFTRFGLSGFTDEIYELFHRRAFDAAAITDTSVSVFFNETKLDIKNFEKYVDLFIGTKQVHPRAFEIFSDRWEVAATYSESHQFEQLSFANGINTTRGGKHVEYITNQITKKLSEMALSKTKKAVKAQHIKDNLMVFVKCLIVNPAFDTQTKDSLTTPVAKFGSKCELSPKFLAELYKSGIIEKAISLTDFHQEKQLVKTDGKKNKKLYVSKLDDANLAGTKESDKCTLILTEGDSAKTMAISGLSIIGREHYGVFPLRGKILNVKDAANAKIAANEEITSVKKIMGLQQGKKYTDLSELRYGKIMILCDQDSVLGDTPLLLKNKDDLIEFKTIENISSKWELNENGKEYGNNNEYQVWTDSGWTDIKHIMRHKVEKDIYRVLTHTGIVDVTEDHSLLTKDSDKIAPKDCKIGDELLHSFPIFNENKIEIPDDLEKLVIKDLWKYASLLKMRYYQSYKKEDLIKKLYKYKNTEFNDLNYKSDISHDEAWVMGFFWADGSCGVYKWETKRKPKNRPNEYIFNRTTYSWAISNCDKSLLEKAQSYLEKIYDYKFNIIKDKCNSEKSDKNRMSYKLIINGGIKTLPIVEKYLNMFYYKNKHPRYKNGNKIIPVSILNAPRNIREHFLEGYYAGDGNGHDINKTNQVLTMDIESKISCQSIYFLCKSLGYLVSINYNHKKPNVYSLIITKGTQQLSSDKIKKIINLGKTEQYVYDLETENHHFQAGVGEIIVHNTDGFHIKGLLFNIFQSLWPSLFSQNGFLTSMLTPILKVSKGDSVHSFYTIPEFERWKKQHEDGKGWKIKYYKGLGTSKEDEAKEYFRDMKLITYQYTGEASDEGIDLGFNKKRADDRKEWLKKFDKNIALEYDPKNPNVSYEDFINKELIHFSNSDLERSINHLLDGLKESTRKILFAAFKRKFTKQEMQVARFAAYVAEVSDYHHGETSLQQAIIGMAQNFIGSNNINLLMPNGQFGSRIQGGDDHASPRYISTMLNPLTMFIYREEDFPILNYKKEDSILIEPEYYIPIIPMVLINGCSGIGTGFSTNLPNFNPTEVINICKIIAESISDSINTDADVSVAKEIINNLEIKEINPWYLGFIGQITKNNGKSDSFISKGKYTWVDDQTVEITELPIGKWTDDYKEFLTEMINQGSPVLKDFDSHYTTKNIKFILKLYPDVRDKIQATFEADFQLSTSKSLSLRNIHLYGEDGAIKNFKDIQTVIKDWACIRIEKYLERKNYQIKKMETEYTYLSAKVRYIQEVIDDVIILKNKKSKEVDKMLLDAKYPKMHDKKILIDEESYFEAAAVNTNSESFDDSDGGYKYLRSMHMDQVTEEKKAKLEKEAADLFVAIEHLKNKSIQDIWKEELEVLNEAWRQYRMDVDREYEDDRLNKKTATNKSRKQVSKKK